MTVQWCCVIKTQVVSLQTFYLEVKVIASHRRQRYHFSCSLSAIHRLCQAFSQDWEICFDEIRPIMKTEMSLRTPCQGRCSYADDLLLPPASSEKKAETSSHLWFLDYCVSHQASLSAKDPRKNKIRSFNVEPGNMQALLDFS